MKALILSDEGDVITNLDPRQLKINPNSIVIIPSKTSFGVVHLTKDRVKRFEEKTEIKSLNYNNFVLKKVTL